MSVQVTDSLGDKLPNKGILEQQKRAFVKLAWYKSILLAGIEDTYSINFQLGIINLFGIELAFSYIVTTQHKILGNFNCKKVNSELSAYCT